MGKINKTNLLKAYNYMRKNGFKAMKDLALERLESHDYDNYTYEAIDEAELEKQRKAAGRYSVKFSILVPAYNTPAEYFRQMIASVDEQTYPHWELIIGDAGDEAAGLKEIAESFNDKRVRYFKLPENKGISENTNAILKEARGDYACLLDHDDFLTPDALFENAKLIEESKVKPRLIYSDEDKCNSEGTEFYEGYSKPDFNLDLILSNNYICHFLVMALDDMKELKLRKDFDGAQDYDITLREAMRFMPTFKEVSHISRVLYHWRCHDESTAANPQSKLYAYEAGKRVVEDVLKSLGWKATVNHSMHLGFFDVSYEPDVFAVRDDIGAVGGKVLNDKSVIIGGAMDSEGRVIFEGLKDTHSGYRNQATLKQDVPLLDVRCMRIRSDLKEILRDVDGIAFESPENADFFDIKFLKNDTELTEICKIICYRIDKLGYKLLYDPNLSVKV